MQDILKDKAKSLAEGAAEKAVSKVAEGLRSLLGGDSVEVQYTIRFPKAPGDWFVRGATLDETIGEPYRCVLEIATQTEGVHPRDLLGHDGVFVYERVPSKHRLAGVVARVEQGRTSDHYTTALVHIVPALAALEHQVNTRIFQNMTVVEILKEVIEEGLAAFGREVDFSKLEREYLKREYTVQYHESDLAFANRLMEEEGIAYVFEHDEKEKCVFVEQNANFAKVSTVEGGSSVKFVTVRGQLGDAEPVYRFELRSDLGATSVTTAEFDWSRAQTVNQATTSKDSFGRAREIYVHDGVATFAEYDEGSHTYGKNDLKQRTALITEAVISSQTLGFGEGRVTGFRAGTVFELKEHPNSALNGKYLLTKVVHMGKADDPSGGPAQALASILPGQHEAPDGDQPRYANRFECLPLDVPYRRPRRTVKPKVHGLQTATVVGPENQDVYTDHHGRIKVQFHWDRQGKYDDHSSCFVRVGQSWAGAGWGCLFIPRKGMEVMISFLDGDPDRPIVTGCLYNGENATPYTLPDDMSKSTIKTRSTTGGEGFNELRFEDKKGSEEVFMHAQRDHNEVVKRNQSVSVGGSQSVSVSGTRSKSVTKDETNDIQGARKTTVKNGDRLTVRSDGSWETIENGDKVIDAANGQVMISSSNHSRISHKNEHWLDLASKAEVYSSKSVKVDAGSAATVTVDHSGKVSVAANASILLQCGEARLELTSDGRVTVNGVEVLLAGKGGNFLADGSGAKVSGNAIEVTASGTTDIKGAVVKIN